MPQYAATAAMTLGVFAMMSSVAYIGMKAGMSSIGHDLLRGGTLSAASDGTDKVRGTSRRLQTVSTYQEGTVLDAEYSITPVYNSAMAVQTACDQDSSCLGWWQGYNNQASNYVILRYSSGNPRSWAAGSVNGSPNSQVISVMARVTPAPTPTPTLTPVDGTASWNDVGSGFCRDATGNNPGWTGSDSCSDLSSCQNLCLSNADCAGFAHSTSDFSQSGGCSSTGSRCMLYLGVGYGVTGGSNGDSSRGFTCYQLLTTPSPTAPPATPTPTQARVCTMGTQVSSAGYGCCVDGATASNCQNNVANCIDSGAYDTEAEALIACASVSSCSYINAYTDGTFMLRADKDRFYLGSGTTYAVNCVQDDPPTPAPAPAQWNNVGYGWCRDANGNNPGWTASTSCSNLQSCETLCLQDSDCAGFAYSDSAYGSGSCSSDSCNIYQGISWGRIESSNGDSNGFACYQLQTTPATPTPTQASTPAPPATPTPTYAQPNRAGVRVTSIAHSTGANGLYFYFAKDEWLAEFPAFGGAPVQQFRGGALIWTGSVTIWDNSGGVHGRRASGQADGQWAVDDIIYNPAWAPAPEPEPEPVSGCNDEGTWCANKVSQCNNFGTRCPATCGMCGGDPEPQPEPEPVSGCNDDGAWCANKVNNCDKFGTQCPATCGLCGGGAEPAPVPEPGPEPAPASGCEDDGAWCANKVNQCNKFGSQCPVTCGTCATEPEPAPSPTPDVPCEDAGAWCANKIGQCHKFGTQCLVTCGTCHTEPEPAPSPTPSAGCDDEGAWCANKVNQCDKFGMRCPVTCGQCGTEPEPGPSPTPEVGCEDAGNWCASKASKCDKENVWTKCPKTCGKCAPEPEPAPMPGCKDEGDWCLSKKSKCHKQNIWTKCPVTCEKCPSESPGCKDDGDWCMSKAGKCNKENIWTQCPVTCKKCP